MSPSEPPLPRKLLQRTWHQARISRAIESSGPVHRYAPRHSGVEVWLAATIVDSADEIQSTHTTPRHKVNRRRDFMVFNRERSLAAKERQRWAQVELGDRRRRPRRCSSERASKRMNEGQEQCARSFPPFAPLPRATQPSRQSTNINSTISSIHKHINPTISSTHRHINPTISSTHKHINPTISSTHKYQSTSISIQSSRQSTSISIHKHINPQAYQSNHLLNPQAYQSNHLVNPIIVAHMNPKALSSTHHVLTATTTSSSKPATQAQ